MKAKFLKMAGVSSEKEFYKKFPTEEAFFKAHPKAKGMLKKAQVGAEIGDYTGGELVGVGQNPVDFYGIKDSLDKSITGMTDDERQQLAYQQSMFNAQQQSSSTGSNESGGLGGIDVSQLIGSGGSAGDMSQLASLMGKKGARVEKKKGGKRIAFEGDLLKNLGGAAGISNSFGRIAQGIQALKAQKEQLKGAEQAKAVSDVSLQAAMTVEEPTRRRYVRPEDMITSPNQAFMSYGTGSNFLQAEDGAMIGGNPTEIQNTYAPITLYNDLGYEPLDESSDIKRYRQGGFLSNFERAGGNQVVNTATSTLSGGNPGADVGGEIGKLIGSATGIPGASIVGNVLGSVAGGLLNRKGEKIEKAQKQTGENINKAAFMQSARALNSQYSSFVKNGGAVQGEEYKWHSHTWTPQLIAKWGDVNVSDIDKVFRPKEMNTLQNGGKRVNPNVMSQWNTYLSWLDEKGLRGKPELDRDELGIKMLDEYKKVNPNFSITQQDVGSIQEYLKDYRNWVIDRHKSGKEQIKFAQYPGQNYERFMPDIAEFEQSTGKNFVDFYPGQRTTSVRFPQSYINEKLQGWAPAAGSKDVKKNRTGGNLRQNETLSMNLGGELSTLWGGHAEPISDNPYSDSETIMFRGQSHDESDGDGRTGIGVSYGDGGELPLYNENREQFADVEVERNEPAEKIDGDLVVYGNLKVPNFALSAIGDDSAKGKKFKNYVAELSKKENKQNKIIENSENVIENFNISSPYDRLKFNSHTAMIQGANQKLKKYAEYKQNAAGVQEAINQTAREMNLDADALAKGKIKNSKNDEGARNGGLYPIAQTGYQGGSITEYLKSIGQPVDKAFRKKLAEEKGIKNYTGTADQNRLLLSKLKQQPAQRQPLVTRDQFLKDATKFATIADKEIYEKINKERPVASTALEDKMMSEYDNELRRKQETEKMTSSLPFIADAFMRARPPINRPLDPSQTYGEMVALATNQLEPVQAQQVMPILRPFQSISFQDQLNANQADFNALQRQLGYNPAALAGLAAQKYAANQKVLAEEFRTNQALREDVLGKNASMLYETQLKNIGLLDQQYARQAQARSATKATAQAALNSIADKITKNRAENLQMNIAANMFPNFRYDAAGRLITQGGTFFNTPSAEKKEKDGAKNGKTLKSAFNNGSIVKSLKRI